MVTIYTTRFCPYCVRAKQLFNHKDISFNEIPVDGNNRLRQELITKSGQHTVPQIWIGATHVGGCDDLFDLEQTGKLDQLLALED